MFKEYNANPKNKKTGDCVIRAISIALEKDYFDVYRELFETSLKCGYHITDPKCYDRYLKANGWIKMKQPRKLDGKKYTGREFAKNLRTTTLAHIGGHHMTVFKDGDIWDTWDCSGGSIGNYWQKE